MPETVQLKYVEAVNAALRRALDEDDRVLVYGEDVAKPGGVFGATKGLGKQFGARVFDTPISESAILGSAIGAAMMGMQPVVEIMWVDFSLVALDQIVNQAANVRYVSNGTLAAPVTIRTQQGTLPGSCAQHSQSLEAFFAHVPGLRVCLPATAQDAYDLLLTAIHTDDPVLVIENRGLYAGDKQDVVIGGPVQPLGGATIRRAGSDATVASWGATVHVAAQACAELEREGISAELIDLRWIAPLDLGTILDSVRRTGRLVVVHEANVSGGFGAELAARVGEAAFGELRAPVVRVGTPDVRMPAAPVLQAAVLPDVGRVVQAVRTVMDHEVLVVSR